MNIELTNRQKQAIETKNKIFSISIHLFEKRGFDNVHIKDICEHAQVSIGTFYHYYKSKSDIFYEIYTRADEFFETIVKESLQEKNSTDRIIKFFDFYADQNTKTGIDTLRQMLTIDNKNYIKKGRAMQTVLMDIIRTGQQDGEITSSRSREELCETLFIIARGVVFDWGLHDGNYDLREKMRCFIEACVKTVRTNPL